MSNEAPKLEVVRFYGSVNVTDWVYGADGENYLVFQGLVSILEASKMAGFQVKEPQGANWFARVEGKTQSYNLPGCKVRAIVDHPEGIAIARSSQSRVLIVP